jgi:hypothetical protein
VERSSRFDQATGSGYRQVGRGQASQRRVTSAGAGHDLWAMDKERGWCSTRAEVSCFASWPATGCCDDDASQIYTPRHCDVMLWREVGEERWRGEGTTAA